MCVATIAPYVYAQEKAALRPQAAHEAVIAINTEEALDAYAAEFERMLRARKDSFAEIVFFGRRFSLESHRELKNSLSIEVYDSATMTRLGTITLGIDKKEHRIFVSMCTVRDPSARQALFFVLARVAQRQKLAFIDTLVTVNDTFPGLYNLSPGERFAYVGCFLTALRSVETVTGLSREHTELPYDPIMQLGNFSRGRGAYIIRGRPDTTLLNVPIDAPIYQLMPPAFLREVMAVRRDFLVPLFPRQDQEGLCPLMGPDAAITMFLFDPKAVTVVDEIPLELSAQEAEQVSGERAVFTREDYALGRREGLDKIGPNWHVHIEWLLRSFSINPYLLYELEYIGARDIHIHRLDDRRMRVDFTWAYPGERPRARSITFIRARLDDTTDYAQLGITPQSMDFVLLKGLMQLFNEENGGEYLLRHTLALAKPGAAVLCDHSTKEVVARSGVAMVSPVVLKVPPNTPFSVTLSRNWEKAHLAVPFGYGDSFSILRRTKEESA